MPLNQCLETQSSIDQASLHSMQIPSKDHISSSRGLKNGKHKRIDEMSGNLPPRHQKSLIQRQENNVSKGSIQTNVRMAKSPSMQSNLVVPGT